MVVIVNGLVTVRIVRLPEHRIRVGIGFLDKSTLAVVERNRTAGRIRRYKESLSYRDKPARNFRAAAQAGNF
jgi:hypothetical protein